VRALARRTALASLPDQLGNQGTASRGGGARRAGAGAGCGMTCSTGGGGGATRSATLTGLGVRVGGGLSEKKECSDGGCLTVIWTVCGTKPFFVNVTDWLSTANVSEHGVWQVWPAPVRTSAPLGTDWNCKVCGDGGDGSRANRSNDNAEHPASPWLSVAATATRTIAMRGMTASVPKGWRARFAATRRRVSATQPHSLSVKYGKRVVNAGPRRRPGEVLALHAIVRWRKKHGAAI